MTQPKLFLRVGGQPRNWKYLEKRDEGPNRGWDEPDDVHEGHVFRLFYHERREERTEYDSQGIGHTNDHGCVGSLVVVEPVLADFGGHTADEGTRHSRQGLADQGQPIFSLIG